MSTAIATSTTQRAATNNPTHASRHSYDVDQQQQLQQQPSLTTSNASLASSTASTAMAVTMPTTMAMARTNTSVNGNANANAIANVNTVSPYSSLASKCIQQGHFHQAMDYYLKALEEYESTSPTPPADMNSATSIPISSLVEWCNAAATYFNLGALAKKIQDYHLSTQYIHQSQLMYQQCYTRIQREKDAPSSHALPATASVCLPYLLVETYQTRAHIHAKYLRQWDQAIECHECVIEVLDAIQDAERSAKHIANINSNSNSTGNSSDNGYANDDIYRMLLPNPCGIHKITIQQIDFLPLTEPKRLELLSNSLQQLGKCHIHEGNWSSGMSAYEEAYFVIQQQLQRKNAQPNHPPSTSATSLALASTTLSKQRSYEQSLQFVMQKMVQLSKYVPHHGGDFDSSTNEHAATAITMGTHPTNGNSAIPTNDWKKHSQMVQRKIADDSLNIEDSVEQDQVDEDLDASLLPEDFDDEAIILPRKDPSHQPASPSQPVRGIDHSTPDTSAHLSLDLSPIAPFNSNSSTTLQVRRHVTFAPVVSLPSSQSPPSSPAALLSTASKPRTLSPKSRQLSPKSATILRRPEAVTPSPGKEDASETSQPSSNMASHRKPPLSPTRTTKTAPATRDSSASTNNLAHEPKSNSEPDDYDNDNETLEHDEVIEELQQQAQEFIGSGDYDQALQCYEHYVILQSERYGKESLQVAKALQPVGHILICQDNIEGGLDLYQAASVIYESNNCSSLDMAILKREMGRAYLQLEKCQSANKYLVQSLEILTQLPDDIKTNNATIEGDEVQVYELLQRVEFVMSRLDHEREQRAKTAAAVPTNNAVHDARATHQFQGSNQPSATSTNSTKVRSTHSPQYCDVITVHTQENDTSGRTLPRDVTPSPIASLMHAFRRSLPTIEEKKEDCDLLSATSSTQERMLLSPDFADKPTQQLSLWELGDLLTRHDEASGIDRYDLSPEALVQMDLPLPPSRSFESSSASSPPSSVADLDMNPGMDPNEAKEVHGPKQLPEDGDKLNREASQCSGSGIKVPTIENALASVRSSEPARDLSIKDNANTGTHDDIVFNDAIPDPNRRNVSSSLSPPPTKDTATTDALTTSQSLTSLETYLPTGAPKSNHRRAASLDSSDYYQTLGISPRSSTEYSTGDASGDKSSNFDAVVDDDGICADGFTGERSSALWGSNRVEIEFNEDGTSSRVSSFFDTISAHADDDMLRRQVNGSEFMEGDYAAFNSSTTMPLKRSTAQDLYQSRLCLPRSPLRKGGVSPSWSSPSPGESSRTGLLNPKVRKDKPSKVLKLPSLAGSRSQSQGHSSRAESMVSDAKSDTIASYTSKNRFVKAISSPFRRSRSLKRSQSGVATSASSPSPEPRLRIGRVNTKNIVAKTSKKKPGIDVEPEEVCDPDTPMATITVNHDDDDVSVITFIMDSSESKQITPQEGQWWWGVSAEGVEGWFPSTYISQAVQVAGGLLNGKTFKDFVKARPLDFDSDLESESDDCETSAENSSEPPAVAAADHVDQQDLADTGGEDKLDYSKVEVGAASVTISAGSAPAAASSTASSNDPKTKSAPKAEANAATKRDVQATTASVAAVAPEMKEANTRRTTQSKIADLQATLKEQEIEHGIDSSPAATTLFALSVIYTKSEKSSEAISCVTRALKIQKAHGNLGEAGQSLFVLADAYGTLGQYQSALSCYSEAKRLQESAFGEYHEEIAKTLNRIGNVLARQGEFDLAMENHKEALHILKECVGEDSKHPMVSQTLIQIGAVYYKERNSLATNQHPNDSYSTFVEGGMLKVIGRAHEDRGSYRMAIAFFEEKLQFQGDGANLEQKAETLNSLGMLSCRAGLYMEALDYYEKATTIQSELGFQDAVQKAIANVLVGSVYFHLGDFSKAIQLSEESLATLVSKVGKEHETVAATMFQIGLVRARLFQCEGAMNMFHNALDIQNRLCGETHPATLRTVREIGNLYAVYEAELPTAFEEFEDVLDTQKGIHGDRHPNIAETLHSIGVAQARQGNVTEALRTLEECYNMRLEFLGMDHPMQAATLVEIAKLHLKRNRVKKALHIADAALDIRSECLGDHHLDVAIAMTMKASCLVARGANAEAGKLFDVALPIAEKAVGSNHPDVADIYMEMGRMHLRSCRFDEATANYEKAMDLYRKADMDDDHPGIKTAKAELENVERAEMLCV